MTLKKTLVDSVCGLVLPKSQDTDGARREFIMNILLGAIISLFAACISMHVIKWGLSSHSDSASYVNDAMSLFSLILIQSVFVVMLFLSHRGFSRVVSYFFISLLLSLAAYMGLRWGVDVNASLLFYILAIVMSGILISTRSSFVVTILSSASIFGMAYAQINRIISPNSYWRTTDINMSTAVSFVVIFFIITGVSWLSNREMEKALVRARRSERELKKERDSLEVKVEERTKELREAQAEKMIQLYRFAEFGRLSSGFFHDLINPLSAVALNMERVRSWDGDSGSVSETKLHLDSAVSATKKMEDMVTAVRKQMSKQSIDKLFSLNEEIEEVIDILAYKAMKAGIEVVFSRSGDINVFGDAMKFNQVILNLIGNAIDSYLPSSVSGEGGLQKVIVDLRQERDEIVLRVEDYGIGIPKENLVKIFEPFFTTKGENGMGIGLPMVKRIVEVDFDGTIALKSQRGEGTSFIITFKSRTHGKGKE